MKSRHRGRSPLPAVLAGATILALTGALGAVIIHDSAEPVATRTVPGPTVTTTVTRTAVPKPEDPVSAAYKRLPLANLKKGNRVIHEDGTTRELCTFQEWNGSIVSATIRCGSRTKTVRTGFLTPVEVMTP